MTTEELNAALNGFTTDQLAEYAELETDTDKQTQDWYKYLQGQSTGNLTKSSFINKYGIYMIGAAVFVAVLFMMNAFTKK